MEYITDISSKFVYINESTVLDWLEGRDIIWTPAVYCIMLSLEKVLHMMNISINILIEEDRWKRKKLFICMTHNMGWIFDFLYAAALDNKDDIFYQNNPESEDLRLLLNWWSFYMVENPDKHIEITK